MNKIKSSALKILRLVVKGLVIIFVLFFVLVLGQNMFGESRVTSPQIPIPTLSAENKVICNYALKEVKQALTNDGRDVNAYGSRGKVYRFNDCKNSMVKKISEKSYRVKNWYGTAIGGNVPWEVEILSSGANQKSLTTCHVMFFNDDHIFDIRNKHKACGAEFLRELEI